jgi:glucosamine kinase
MVSVVADMAACLCGPRESCYPFLMYFLGIDGGGSRTRARVRDSAGVLLGEAEGGPSNLHQDFGGAVAMIVATAAKCGVPLEQVHAGLGLAGLVTSVGAERLNASKLPFASMVADNDAYVACLGAFKGGDGGIVIAGTGSIGFALVNGERHVVGGWGFALGDHGSGAWVGHHAVRRAALAVDGLLQPTPMVEGVLEVVGRDRQSISIWSQTASPKDYGRFAPLVFSSAAKGDVQGMTIVIEGAAAISNIGRALLARKAGRLCLLGGLAQVYPPYLDADVRAALVLPEADAAEGAIMMARMANGLSP